MNRLEIGNRIKDFLKSKGVTQSQLAEKTGYSQSVISGMMSGKRNVIPLAEKVSKIYDIDLMFLLGGEERPKESPVGNIRYYPDVDASMGGVLFVDDPDEGYLDILIPGYNDCKYAINAFGDSMHPLIKSGQIVLLSPWTENYLDWGRIYLVITKSGYRAIKRLYPGSDDNKIKCVSENEDLYPAYEIEKSDMVHCFIVKGWICRDVM